MKPKAIYTGFCPHDADCYYRCPVCKRTFSGWDISHNKINGNGIREYCPWCKTELEGLK
jgi:hypothetical protein